MEELLHPQQLLWVVATILHIIVQIVPRAMEQIGVMEIAIGSIINVYLYDKVLVSVFFITNASNSIKIQRNENNNLDNFCPTRLFQDQIHQSNLLLHKIWIFTPEFQIHFWMFFTSNWHLASQRHSIEILNLEWGNSYFLYLSQLLGQGFE